MSSAAMCALPVPWGTVAKGLRTVAWAFDADCGNDQSTFACKVLSLVATVAARAANMTPANMTVRLHISRPPACSASLTSTAQLASPHDEKPSFPFASTKLCVNLLLTRNSLKRGRHREGWEQD